MNYVDLKELEYFDKLRISPLGEIGAEVRNIHQTKWREVRDFRIAKEGFAFNQLSGPWLDCNEWRAPMQ
jgi:hypothetical protein